MNERATDRRLSGQAAWSAWQAQSGWACAQADTQSCSSWASEQGVSAVHSLKPSSWITDSA